MPEGKRSHTALPYHLIPPQARNLEARRFEYGLRKYGRDNWKNLSKEQFVDAWNHMYEHMMNFKEGIVDDNIPNVETHLGAICFNCSIIAWALEKGIVTLEDFSGREEDIL